MKTKLEYKIIKSWRKTLALQVKNGKIIVKTPFFVTKRTLDNFVNKHEKWIESKLQNRRKSIIDIEKIHEYKHQARDYIPKRVSEIAKKYNLEYNYIKITSARSRWGSCTSKKNLNFSFRLILTPKDVIDYVIVHELSHLTHMNHGKFFWKEVEKMMPNYKLHEKWLKENSDLFTY